MYTWFNSGDASVKFVGATRILSRLQQTIRNRVDRLHTGAAQSLRTASLHLLGYPLGTALYSDFVVSQSFRNASIYMHGLYASTVTTLDCTSSGRFWHIFKMSYLNDQP